MIEKYSATVSRSLAPLFFKQLFKSNNTMYFSEFKEKYKKN